MSQDPDRNPHLPSEHWHTGNGTTDWSVHHTPHSGLKTRQDASLGMVYKRPSRLYWMVSRLLTVSLLLSIVVIPILYILGYI